ncbi:MAG: fatty acid desaturase [Candidatus Omnitrophica bacterium]|nr:fatty acid desaturase [Candidatus Omnitrophota bacterium]
MKKNDDTPKGIYWPSATFIIATHLIAIFGLPTFNWPAFWICLALTWMTACLGITLCYHRLLTHRSFSVPKPIEYLLTLIACLAWQGGPITWVAVHRRHHGQSDQQGDPHSPRHGFFWSHMGWCLYESYFNQHPDQYEKYAPDMTGDPIYRFLEKTFVLWNIPLGIILYLSGGWTFVIWGIFIRITFVYHITWLVNSAAHTWGYQSYKTSDQSKNLWWVAWLSFGEGWHNNHHAFQTSARHGLNRGEFDLTYTIIRFLERLNLAKNIKLPTKQQLQTTL